MRISVQANNQPLRREWCWVLAALALLLGIRIVQAVRAETLTPDGIVYIEMARLWERDPAAAINSQDYHIAYPVTVYVTHQVMTAIGVAGAPDSWDHAGQVVAIIASMGALVGVWFWCRLMAGPRAAMLSLVIFGVGKKWVVIGSDVLSDGLSSCFQIWGIAMAYLMLDALGHRRRRAIALGALAGLLIGGGYLVRPESLIILMVTLPVGLFVWWHKRPQAYLAIGSLGAATLGTVLAGLPYMLAIGGLTKKKDFGEMLRRSFAHAEGSGDLLAMTMLGSVGDLLGRLWQLGCAAAVYLSMMTEAIHPISAGLALSWVIAWLLFRRKSFWAYPTPTPLGGWFIFLLGLGLFLVNAMLLMGHGYMSHRHTLIAVLAVTPLIGAGVFSFTDLLRRGVAATKLPTLSSRVTFWLFAAGLPVIILSHALAEAPHAGKGVYRAASYEIAEQCLQSPPSGPILADESWVRHYVGQLAPDVAHAQPISLGKLSAEEVAALAAEHQAGFIVFRSNMLPEDQQPALEGYELWRHYPAGKKCLYVYRCTGATP